MSTVSSALLRWLSSALVLLAICVPARSIADASALDRVTSEGVLRVAMSGNQQPFNFLYGKQKSPVGLDVDLAGELARVMGVELQLITMEFNDLIDALEAGDADMVISGMTMTPDRTRRVSFIGPYVLSGKSLLASRRAAKTRTMPQDFNQPGTRLVALKGSTSETLVRESLPGAELNPVADYDAGIRLLLSGKVDGMVADTPILAYTRNRYRDEGLQLLATPLSVEPMGIAIARGDAQFENFLRNYMGVFEKTGLLMTLYERWFELAGGDLYSP